MNFNIKNLTVFQKINYFLIIALLLSFLGILFGFISDVYNMYINNVWRLSSLKNTYFNIGIALAFHFLFVLPNTFTIYVHEMRKQLIPKIPYWYNFFKNAFIILIIALLLIPLAIYPLLTSNQSTDLEFLTKLYLEKRHSGIKTGYVDIVYFTLWIIVFLIPIIGIINWFHAMVWKGYSWFSNNLK